MSSINHEMFAALLREPTVRSNQPPVIRLPFLIVEPAAIYGPARRHRRRRIQKKWLKRYGEKVVGYDDFLGDKVYVDCKTGLAWCHRRVALALEAKFRDWGVQMALQCRQCGHPIGVPGQSEVLREQARLSGESFSAWRATNDPAEGEYTCESCGEVNGVRHSIGGEWVQVLMGACDENYHA